MSDLTFTYIIHVVVVQRSFLTIIRSSYSRFRALYNYKPQNEDEVELCEGDIVYVMEKCDDGWFVGTSQRTGIFGTFPGNYVTTV